MLSPLSVLVLNRHFLNVRELWFLGGAHKLRFQFSLGVSCLKIELECLAALFRGLLHPQHPEMAKIAKVGKTFEVKKNVSENKLDFFSTRKDVFFFFAQATHK